VLTIKSALLSLQSLLSSPEPKDPQDAEVANMLMNHPEQFQKKARDWAISHAGAPTTTQWSSIAPDPVPSKPKSKKTLSDEEAAREQALRWECSASTLHTTNGRRYQGYNKDLIDRFVNMGFDIDRVVEAFNFVQIDRNGGEDYELEEAYMGDITARLLGEP